jgi:hypothetical protein
VGGEEVGEGMSGYTKLFGSIIHSTVWREPNHVRLVWVTMLAMQDRDGVVEASLPGLADAARVTLEECKEALGKLMSPDPYSRSKDHEGRRIAEVDGGWVLLNSDKYRELQSQDDRKQKDAARQARKRQRDDTRHAPSRPSVTCHADTVTVTPRHAPSRDVHKVTTTEEEAEATPTPEASQDPTCKVEAKDLTGRAPPDPPQPPPPESVNPETMVPCPPAADLLTPQQRAALEVALIPGWAIDALVAEFASRYAADQSELRTLVRWRKGCSQAVNGNWNNPARRPQKPDATGSPPIALKGGAVQRTGESFVAKYRAEQAAKPGDAA